MSHFYGKLKKKLEYRYIIDQNKKFEELELDDIKKEKIKIKPTFIVKDGNRKAAVSSWVSAKRTRSYPYTRIFETLSNTDIKKITIFPVVKDEGFDGDRDYIQWDTFSICSYLDVFAIPAFYVKAKKNSDYDNKVTKQEFEYKYLYQRIKEILESDITPKRWNDHMRNSIGSIIHEIIAGYEKISKDTGVKFHSASDLEKNLHDMKNSDSFRSKSQKKSSEAQKRETVTDHKSEKVFGFPKGSVTLDDHLGGRYTWTVDGFHIIKNIVFLMEMKHAKEGKPKMADIKDALFKFHFYGNISELHNDEGRLKPIPVLVASSGNLKTVELSAAKEFDILKKECMINNIKFILAGSDMKKSMILDLLLSS